MKAILASHAVQRATQCATRARQPRHHRADGDAHDVGQITVRQPLELAAHQQLTKPIGQTAHGPLDRPDVIGLKQ